MGREPADVADALARVCTDPGRFRRFLDQDDWHLVDEVLGGGAATDRELRSALERLHEALRLAGAANGVYGAEQRGMDPIPIGSASPNRSEILYLCPQRHCSRFFLPRNSPDEPVPICSVFGKPLRKRGL